MSVYNSIENILLISPPHPNTIEFPINKTVLFNRKYRCEPPLGLWSLASELRLFFPDLNVKVFDLNFQALQEYLKDNLSPATWKEVLKGKIKEMCPQIIGISCLFATTANICIETARIVKDISQTKVIFGGGEVTTNINRFLNEKAIDYCISGEGETALIQLVSALNNTKSLENISGVCFRNEVGKFIINNQTEYSKDLNSLPLLDPTLLPFEQYPETGRVAGLNNVNEVSIPYETSRGCPFKCTYCSSHNLWGYSIRYKSIQRISQELDAIKSELDFKHIYLQDDTPFLDKKRSLFILKLIRERGIVLHLPNSLRVNSLDHEIIDALANSAVKTINLAIESCNTDTLKDKMKKNVDIKLVRILIDYIRDNTNMKVTGNILLGFPGETLDDMYVSLDELKRLRLDWVDFGILTPLPGTEVFDLANSHGYISGNKNGLNYANANLETEHFTAKQVKTIVEKSNIEFNFKNNINIREGLLERAKEDFEYVLSIAPCHVEARNALLLCTEKISINQYGNT